MSYRKDIDRATVLAEESDVDKTEFVLADDIKGVLDSIETRVDEIRDRLSNISGLTEIDEIYTLVDKLYSDLY
jgi:hypothetical protein